jgi:hypothetical protein
MLPRRELTNLLLATLLDATPLVGDMVIPRGGGWDLAPNAPGAQFTPYTVLITLTASRSVGPFGESQADWQFPYMVESFGASREQCEYQADKVRSAFEQLAKTRHTFGTETHYVQQARVDSIGAVNRVAVTDPAFYGQQDGVTLWLSKELT